MSGPVISTRDVRYNEAKKVTQVGTLGDTVLTFGKIIIGLMAGSAALVAEGLHSGADLLFDLVVLVGMKIARKKPDEGHPYGHGKFEGLITLLLAAILLMVAVGIVIDAVHRMGEENLVAPGQLAFWVAMISIGTKEALFQYTVRVGRKLKSNIIMANAWHHRADSISSFAAMLGIGGALMGYPILDPVAAIAVAFFVSKVGFEIGHKAVKELTDSTEAVDEEIREQINRIIHEIPEVISAHFVTPRQLGPDIIVDVHIVVPMHLTVSEGHQVAEKVKFGLLREVVSITEVVVHVDTEDDMVRNVPILATRQEILAWILSEMPTNQPIIRVIRLQPNYSHKGIHLDLVLQVNETCSLAEIHADAKKLCDRLLTSDKGIVEVRTSIGSVEKRKAESESTTP
ncbi:MAG: cation transporter [Magnetococcales bacterium]|nr:cation transporter [Magnetococcales bacterium]